MDYSHEVRVSNNAPHITMSFLTYFKDVLRIYKSFYGLTMKLAVIKIFYYRPPKDIHRATYFFTALCGTHRRQHTSLLPSVEPTEDNILLYCPLWNPQKATYFSTALCGTNGGQHTSLLPSVEPTEGNILLYCPLWNPRRATYFFTVFCGTHGRQHTFVLPKEKLPSRPDCPY
jgi:hypothetical protein